MKKDPKTWFATFVILFIFTSFYIIRYYDDEHGSQSNISIVNKESIGYAMTCLANGFYSIQKSYRDFKDMWSHYYEVIDVSEEILYI